jgi:ATP-dependent helicase/nuclease subunit A
MTQFVSDINERLAALETSQSCHVEAPAGSGKTHLLTSRFLKLLGEVNHPQEILALTFTKKAAGEMRSRVLVTFQRAVNETPSKDADDAFLLELARMALQKHGTHQSLLFSIDGLNIMTFHSFCYHIAKRAPLESSLPPDFNIIEENAQPALILETMDSLRRRIFKLRRNHPARQAFDKRLLYNNNHWSRFENEMKGVILNRDRFEYLIHEIARHGLSSLPDILKSRLSHYVETFLIRFTGSKHLQC